MNVTKMVLSAVKDVMLSFTPTRSLLEGLFRYDFKIGEARKNLMQISFSALAAWPLFIILLVIWLDPTQSFFSLHLLMSRLFSVDGEARVFLLDGQVSTMATIAVAFFFLQWIVRREYLWVALIFFFLQQGEMHVHLALSAVIGVYLSRAFYLWWVSLDLVSRTYRIWTWAAGLQFVATLLVAIGSLILLDQYQRLQYFSGSLAENRFLFLFSVIFTFYFFQFLFLAVWGHFTFQKPSEPSYMPVFFSTSVWLGRFKIRGAIESQLKLKTTETLAHHLASLGQLKEMKDQSPGIRMGALEETLNKELAYLQRAASRLTAD